MSEKILEDIRGLYTEAKILSSKAEAIAKRISEYYREPPGSIDICRVYNALVETKDFIEEEVIKPLSTHTMTMANIEIIAAFERDGVPSVRLTNPDALFSINTRHSCSMVNKERGMAWLEANGHSNMIQPTVNSSALASFAKNYTLEFGLDLPEDIFKVSQMRYVQRKKS